MAYSRAIIRPNEMGELLTAAIYNAYCWFSWSDDGGVTWETWRQVTLDTCDDEQPGITEMPDGSLRIAVSQSDAVRVYGSTDDGTTWNTVGVLT